MHERTSVLIREFKIFFPEKKQTRKTSKTYLRVLTTFITLKKIEKISKSYKRVLITFITLKNWKIYF